MFTAAQVEGAHARLRGQIVHTPLIGGLSLPGFAVPADLRVKPEVLQAGGSLHARGALHWLARALGRHKGVVIGGGERAVLAAAWAAAQHRLPALVCLDASPSPAVARLLEMTGCEVVIAPDGAAGLARARGFHLLPGAEDPDHALGIASLACELHADLPAECDVVLVAPPPLAPPLAAGLAALGRPLPVQGVAARASAEPLRTALAVGVRVLVGLASASALEEALESGASSACVVLAE